MKGRILFSAQSALSKSRPATGPSGKLFATKEDSMRKMTLAITVSCVVASVLFFLLPAYRQAIRVSLDPLYCAMDGDCFHRGVQN
jgi:hypothetical protein